MAKRMNLDDTWKKCEIVWLWVKEQEELGTGLRKYDHPLFDKESVMHSCFFCDYAYRMAKKQKQARDIRGRGCRFCPARKIDKSFDCIDNAYDCNLFPDAFADKIVSLNRKRLKKQKLAEEHKNFNRQ